MLLQLLGREGVRPTRGRGRIRRMSGLVLVACLPLMSLASPASAGSTAPPVTQGFVTYANTLANDTCTAGQPDVAHFSFDWDAAKLTGPYALVASLEIFTPDTPGNGGQIVPGGGSLSVPIVAGQSGTFAHDFPLPAGIAGDTLQFAASVGDYHIVQIDTIASCADQPTAPIATPTATVTPDCANGVTVTVTGTGLDRDWYTTLFVPGGGFYPLFQTVNNGTTVTRHIDNWGAPNLVIQYSAGPAGTGGVQGEQADGGTYVIARPTSCQPPAAGTFRGLAPTRLLDTRNGTGASKAAVAGGGSVAFQVAGRGGVPSTGVSAVALNVTATAPTKAGYVTAYADGGTRPTASNLNFSPSETIPNLVIAPVGADGKVRLFNGSVGTVQLVADVAGYYLAGVPTVAGAFKSLAPQRALDTRIGTGSPKAPVAHGATLVLQVAGRAGVPASGVSAVVVNLTVTAPTAAGYVTAFGHGSARPASSNLNFSAGQTIPNLAVVPVGADGRISLYNGSAAGSVQLVADIEGYYLSGTPTREGAFKVLAPSRVLDTRVGTGSTGPVAANDSVFLDLSGTGGIPADGVAGIVMNVTVVQPATAGFITGFPAGETQPLASNLNFTKNETIPNMVQIGAAPPELTFYNGSAGTVQLVADVSGYFVNGA